MDIQLLMRAMGVARGMSLKFGTEAWGASSLKHAFYLLIVESCPLDAEDDGWLVAQIVDLREHNKQFRPIDNYEPIRRRLQIANEMYNQLWRLLPSMPRPDAI